jgi:hypothetical protein
MDRKKYARRRCSSSNQQPGPLTRSCTPTCHCSNYPHPSSSSSRLSYHRRQKMRSDTQKSSGRCYSQSLPIHLRMSSSKLSSSKTRSTTMTTTMTTTNFPVSERVAWRSPGRYYHRIQSLNMMNRQSRVGSCMSCRFGSRSSRKCLGRLRSL